MKESKMAATKIVGFNYDVLEIKDRAPLAERAQAIRTLMKQTAEGIVRVGSHLKEAREAIGKEKFQAWIKAELGMRQPEASNYMAAAEQFGELDCLENFQQTALFDLARQNVPAKAVKQAVAEARAGKPITRKRAHEIIAANQSEGELSPLARDAARRLRSSLSTVAERVDDMRALPQEEIDFLVDQMLSIVQQLRVRRATVLLQAPAEKKAPTPKGRRLAAVSG
jgi:hypothetical protein